MNNYHIYEEIGKGKYSTVYKVYGSLHVIIICIKGTEKEIH
jgi:hypothetical protein